MNGNGLRSGVHGWYGFFTGWGEKSVPQAGQGAAQSHSPPNGMPASRDLLFPLLSCFSGIPLFPAGKSPAYCVSIHEIINFAVGCRSRHK